MILDWGGLGMLLWSLWNRVVGKIVLYKVTLGMSFSTDEDEAAEMVAIKWRLQHEHTQKEVSEVIKFLIDFQCSKPNL